MHIGGDVVVGLKDVVAILDLRTVGERAATREFLQFTRSEKDVVDISDGDPKSVIITPHTLFLSPISSLTLKKRGENVRLLTAEGDESN